MSFANALVGKREDSGSKFIASAGLSLQEAEAEVAFKQAYQLAGADGASFTVEFAWQANERAVRSASSMSRPEEHASGPIGKGRRPDLETLRAEPGLGV